MIDFLKEEWRHGPDTFRAFMVASGLMSVFLVLVTVASIARELGVPPPKEHVYDVAFGQVLCGKAERTRCGIKLSKCHDGHVYECMLNVRERGE